VRCAKICPAKSTLPYAFFRRRPPPKSCLTRTAVKQSGRVVRGPLNLPQGESNGPHPVAGFSCWVGRTSSGLCRQGSRSAPIKCQQAQCHTRPATAASNNKKFGGRLQRSGATRMRAACRHWPYPALTAVRHFRSATPAGQTAPESIIIPRRSALDADQIDGLCWVRSDPALSPMPRHKDGSRR
jgi:hypothetical protein